jgi:hypothetical protein
MNRRRSSDPLLTVIGLVGYGIAAVAFGYMMYLFISVVFLGGSSSCPQNLC